jgi:hypothetical protein
MRCLDNRPNILCSSGAFSFLGKFQIALHDGRLSSGGLLCYQILSVVFEKKSRFTVSLKDLKGGIYQELGKPSPIMALAMIAGLIAN